MTDHEQYIPPEEQQVSIIVKQSPSEPYGSSSDAYIKTERNNPEPDLLYSGEFLALSAQDLTLSRVRTVYTAPIRRIPFIFSRLLKVLHSFLIKAFHITLPLHQLLFQASPQPPQ